MTGQNIARKEIQVEKEEGKRQSQASAINRLRKKMLEPYWWPQPHGDMQINRNGFI